MTKSKSRSNRIRQLIRRDGWTVIKIRAVSEHPDPFTTGENKSNTLNYHEMVEWCQKTFEADTWISSLFSYTGNSDPGLRRFVFKNPADATAFSLRWL